MFRLFSHLCCTSRKMEDHGTQCDINSQPLVVICASIDGLRITIRLPSHTATVSELKKQFSSAAAVPRFDLVVCRAGKALNDHCILSEIGMQHCEELVVIRRQTVSIEAAHCVKYIRILHERFQDLEVFPCQLSDTFSTHKARMKMVPTYDESYAICCFPDGSGRMYALGAEAQVSTHPGTVFFNVADAASSDSELLITRPNERWLVEEREPGSFTIKHVASQHFLQVCPTDSGDFSIGLKSEILLSFLDLFSWCCGPDSSILGKFPSTGSYEALMPQCLEASVQAGDSTIVSIQTLSGTTITKVRVPGSETLWFLRKAVARDLQRSPLRLLCQGVEPMGCDNTPLRTIFAAMHEATVQCIFLPLCAIVLLGNLPQVGLERYGKLRNVISKHLIQVANVKCIVGDDGEDIFMPVNPITQTTGGCCVIAFAQGCSADIFVDTWDGIAFDKQHMLTASRIYDVSVLSTFTNAFDSHIGSLHAWLSDKYLSIQSTGEDGGDEGACGA